MKTIQERIILLIDLLGLSTNAFSKGIEVQPTVIYNIIKGRNNPSYEILNKIITTYSVNPTWLFTEKGDVLLNKKKSYNDDSRSYDILLENAESPDNELSKEFRELEERALKDDPSKRILMQNVFNYYNQKTNSKIGCDSFYDLESKFSFLTSLCHHIQKNTELKIISMVNSNDIENVDVNKAPELSSELIEIIDQYKTLYYNVHQYQKELNDITGILISTGDAMELIKKTLQEKGEIRIGFSG